MEGIRISNFSIDSSYFMSIVLCSTIILSSTTCWGEEFEHPFLISVKNSNNWSHSRRPVDHPKKKNNWNINEKPQKERHQVSNHSILRNSTLTKEWGAELWRRDTYWKDIEEKVVTVFLITITKFVTFDSIIVKTLLLILIIVKRVGL